MRHENKPVSSAKALVEQPEIPEPPERAPDSLADLPHAYAVYLQPDGRFVALHLEGVTAKRVEKISPNGAPESAPFATARCSNAMDKRTRQRLWGAK